MKISRWFVTGAMLLLSVPRWFPAKEPKRLRRSRKCEAEPSRQHRSSSKSFLSEYDGTKKIANLPYSMSCSS